LRSGSPRLAASARNAIEPTKLRAWRRVHEGAAQEVRHEENAKRSIPRGIRALATHDARRVALSLTSRVGAHPCAHRGILRPCEDAVDREVYAH
jgi:hypothetical protein